MHETWPANTGRAPDGAGRTDGWRWPSEWDRQNPSYRPPICTTWSADSRVSAAFVAHGRLYVWVGTALIAPGVGPGGAPTLATASAAPWKCWLGFDGQPHPGVATDSRVALFGGGAILAVENDFAIGALYPGRADEALKLQLGIPIAQAASDGWWAGWVTRSGSPALYAARVNAQWRNTECRAISSATRAATPRAGARMLMREGFAYWISEEGALWRLDCSTLNCEPLMEPAPDARIGWCGAEGSHVLRDGGDGIRVGMDAIRPGGVAREAPGGNGPLKDVFAAKELLAVVGEEVVTLDSRTGYVLGGGKFVGQWVAGALADPESDAPDREPRLLMLTQDNEDGNLTSLRPSSGGEEAVWRGAGVHVTGLIVAGRRMYIVHESGVTSIRSASIVADRSEEEQL